MTQTSKKPETLLMYGVEHVKDNDFKYKGKTIADRFHPLGTIYLEGEFGFVANGYDWWRFPISELDNIINNS